VDQVLASGSGREESLAAASSAMQCLHSALRPGGTLLLLSHAPPHRRLELLTGSAAWEREVQVGGCCRRFPVQRADNVIIIRPNWVHCSTLG
jgi:hypothetical protein